MMRFLLVVCCLFYSLATLSQTSVAQPLPAGALTSQQLDHLVQLARLAGSVRYFYPNQATSQADWQAFYVAAIPQLLQAPTQEACIAILRHAFATIAPGVTIQRLGHKLPAGASAGTELAYRWEHHSLNQNKQGLGVVSVLMRLAHLPFASRLVVANLATAQLPAVYTLPLSDAWVASIPLVLPATQANAPIAFRRRARHFQVAQPAQRLAVVMQTWNVLQQFYPYREQLQRAAWPEALRVGLGAAYTAQTDPALLVACQRLVARLGDRHVQVSRQTRTGLYITPPDFALAFELLPDGRTVVARASGKWAATFPVGSLLEQINGQPINPILDSLQRQTSAASTDVARQVVVRQLLHYYWHQASTVHLTVRTGADLHRYPVAFRELRLPANRAGAFRALPDSLLYLDAARLQYPDFVRHLPALQHARGLIVDLRQRPSYGMQTALAHWARTALQSDWFATPVLHAPDFAAVTYDSTGSITAPRVPHLATRTVFLIDPDTFSYGETLVELIRHYHLGLLLGQPTGGTNGEMNFVNISQHFRLSWTGRLVRNRDGLPYQGQGIRPATEVHPTMAAIQQQQDAALQQAVGYLVSAKQ
jgi:hypothetical protein